MGFGLPLPDTLLDDLWRRARAGCVVSMRLWVVSVGSIGMSDGVVDVVLDAFETVLVECWARNADSSLVRRFTCR